MGPTGGPAGPGGASPTHNLPWAGGGSGGNMGPNTRRYSEPGWKNTGGGGGGAQSHDTTDGGAGGGGPGCVLIAYTTPTGP